MLVISGKSSFYIRAEQDLKIISQIVDLPLYQSSNLIIFLKNLIEHIFAKLGIFGTPFKFFIITICIIYYKIKLLPCNCLIITSDRDRDFLYISAMKAAQLSNIEIKLWILSYESTGIEIRAADKKFRINFIDKIFMRLHGANIISYQSHILKFFLLPDLIILRIFRILSGNPWRLGYGANTEIVVFDPIQFQTFKERFKSKTVIFRERPLKKLGSQDLDVIVALPQLYEHNLISLGENRKFISAILSSLEHVTTKIGISLHPKMSFSTYKDILNKYEYVLISDLQNELIRCNTFICINSSTAFWAVSLGKNVIMINLHNLNVRGFTGIRNIRIVNDMKTFRVQLQSILGKG